MPTGLWLPYVRTTRRSLRWSLRGIDRPDCIASIQPRTSLPSGSPRRAEPRPTERRIADPHSSVQPVSPLHGGRWCRLLHYSGEPQRRSRRAQRRPRRRCDIPGLGALAWHIMGRRKRRDERHWHLSRRAASPDHSPRPALSHTQHRSQLYDGADLRSRRQSGCGAGRLLLPRRLDREFCRPDLAGGRRYGASDRSGDFSYCFPKRAHSACARWRTSRRCAACG